MKREVLVALFLLFLFACALRIAAIDISACGTINNGSYTLTANITTTGTCLTINSSNITIDGAGFMISGDGGSSDYGIRNGNSYDNITIFNFGDIRNFGIGIYFSGTSNSTFHNNTITALATSAVGIQFDGTNPHRNNITSNIITTNGTAGYGIYLFSSNLNRVIGNIINTSAASNSNGIRVSGDSNNLTSNTIQTQTSNGIYISGTLNAVEHSNITTYGNGADPVNLDAGNNFIINNSLRSLSTNSEGVYVNAGSRQIIINNTINVFHIGSEAIYLTSGTSGHNISDNLITAGSTNGVGIYFGGDVDSCLVIHNTINTSGSVGHGIHFFVSGTSAPDHNVIESININVTYGVNEYGIYFQGGNNNTITNGNITSKFGSDLRVNGTNITITNVTFNRNITELTFPTNSLGFLTVQDYVNFNVTNTTGILANANVSVYNASFLLNSQLTSAGGITTNILLKDFFANATERISAGAYLINTTLAGYFTNTTTIYLNASGAQGWGTYSIQMDYDHYAPNVTFEGPTPNNASTQISRNVTINITVVDSDSFISQCILQWNGTNETMQMNSTSGTSKLVVCNTTKTNLADGIYNYSIFVNDTAASPNGNMTAYRFVTIDATPPATVTNLRNISKDQNSIYWNWTNPTDSDFSVTRVHINGVFQTETINNFYNATNLNAMANYTIELQTKDTTGNINASNVTNTTSTIFGCIILGSNTTLEYNVVSRNTCFTFGESNIALDCAGFIINHSSADNGGTMGVIASNVENITIKNCLVAQSGFFSTHSGIYLNNSVRATLWNNTILTGGSTSYGVKVDGGHSHNITASFINTTSTSSYPIFLNITNSTIVDDNTLHTTGWNAYGVNIIDGSQSNILRNNTIRVQYQWSDVYGIFLNGTNNTFINNNISSRSNQSIWDVSNSTNTTWVNTLIYSNDLGSVNWTRNNLTTRVNLSLGKSIFLEQNLVGILNWDATLNLNTSARIEIKNLTYTATPSLLKNGIRCDNDNTLCTIINWTGTVLTANVTSFSNYSTGNANTAPNITSVTINPTIAYTNDTLLVNTTFTDNDNNTGNITFYWFVDGASIFNETNRSVINNTNLRSSLSGANFSKNQRVEVNITADDGSLWAINRSANLTIQNSAPTFNHSLISQSTLSGQLFTYKINTSDLDGDTVNHSDNTSLFEINVSTGLINFTPAESSVGTHSIIINLTDGTTNTSSNFTLIITDGTPPNVTLNTINSFTNASNFSIRSSNQTFNVSAIDIASSVQTIYYWFDNGTGADFNITAINQSGEWIASYNVSTLGEGKQGIRIVANDSSGNSNSSFVLNFTVDLNAPNVTREGPTPNDRTNFTISSGNRTFNVTVFDAVTEVSAVYFWFDNSSGQDVNVSASNQSGYWVGSYNLSSLADGRHTVLVIANDTVSNQNNSVSFTFNVDLQPPNITLFSPSNSSNFSIRSNNQTFNVSALDTATAVESIYYWFDNGTGQDFNVTAVNQSGNWVASYNISGVAEGKQGVRIVANDTVGSSNSSFVINFTLDLTSPNVTFITPINNSNFTKLSNNQTFNASVFDSFTTVENVYYWFDNGTGQDFNVTAVNQSGNWVASYNVSNLLEQQQTVRLVANDTVSNVNSTFVLTFTVDPNAPNITNAVNTSPNFRRYQNFTANITLHDGIQLDTYIFSTNASGAWANVTRDINGTQYNASEQANITTPQSTRVCWYYWVNDTSSNINQSTTYCFTVVNTAPTTTVNLNSTEQNYTNGTLTGNWTFSDIDGDAQTSNETKWYNNSIEVLSLANRSTVGPGNTTKNQNWTFSARVFDGTDWSAWVNSSNLSIINSIPSFDVSPVNQTVNSSATLAYDLNCSDTDLDTITYSDNTSQFTINATTGLINATPNENDYGLHSVLITCADDQANSTSIFNYTIIDTEIPLITINGPMGATNGTFMINLSTQEISTCYYKNETAPFATMNITNARNHLQNISHMVGGTYLFTFNCTDGSSNSDNSTYTILVTGVAAELSNSTTANFTANVTASFNLSIMNLTTNISKSTNGTITIARYNVSPESIGFGSPKEFRYYTVDIPAATGAVNLIELVFQYNETDVSDLGIAEADLRFYHYNTSTDRWQEEENYVVDTEANLVRANVTHLSTFVLAHPTTASSGGSSGGSSSSSSGSNPSGWGICGDTICNAGERCAPNNYTNENAGLCFKDCGLCPINRSVTKRVATTPKLPEQELPAVVASESEPTSEEMVPEQAALEQQPASLLTSFTNEAAALYSSVKDKVSNILYPALREKTMAVWQTYNLIIVLAVSIIVLISLGSYGYRHVQVQRISKKQAALWKRSLKYIFGIMVVVAVSVLVYIYYSVISSFTVSISATVWSKFQVLLQNLGMWAIPIGTFLLMGIFLLLFFFWKRRR